MGWVLEREWYILLVREGVIDTVRMDELYDIGGENGHLRKRRNTLIVPVKEIGRARSGFILMFGSRKLGKFFLMSQLTN